MLATLASSPLAFLIGALGLVVAITIHEFAHAWAADRLGDPTPRLAGRLTLNPLSHLDPLGTLALLFVGFGWGRPVTFDPYNLRSVRRDTALISLAGPASNIALAIALSLVLKLLLPPLSIIGAVLSVIISLNIMLAIFNLVPIYPLDGEKILTGILPHNLAVEYTRVMRQWGTFILLFMILPLGGTSPIAALISPIISTLTNLLL